jgi:hypothetical protein
MATAYHNREEMVQAMDLALEAIVSTWRDTGVGSGTGKQAVRLSRYEILRLMARRAMRKSIQHKMRPETRESYVTGVKPSTEEPYGN